MTNTDYFFVSFIPLILAQMAARIYLLNNLQQPADFTGAPWYVRLSFNSGMVRLFELKETVIFYFFGFVGFMTGFIFYVDHLIIGLIILAIFVAGAWMYWKAIDWMDENNRWGTRKPAGQKGQRTVFQHLVKDSFLLFNSIVLIFLMYTQFREYVRGKGYEAGKKEAIEQLRQDSLENLKNK